MRLDAVDHLILDELQRDGRITNKLLAARVGLSPSACLTRVRRLEKKGAVLGYRAIIDPLAIGASFEGWAEIVLTENTPAASARLMDLLDATPSVRSAYHVAGTCDFLLHFVSPSLRAWADFRLRMDDSGVVSSSRLFVVLDRPKLDAPITIARTARRGHLT